MPSSCLCAAYAIGSSTVLIRRWAVRSGGWRPAAIASTMSEGPSASPTTPDSVLLKEIRRAHRCFDALVSGQVRSVAELATVEGISDRYVSSLLPLALLAPDIVDAIAAGRQPPELTAHRLIRTVDLPIAWAAQKQLLGLR